MKRSAGAEPFDQTTSAIARKAEVTHATVSNYIKLGLIKHITASDGTKLMQKGAAALVATLKRDRMAKRFSQKALTA